MNCRPGDMAVITRLTNAGKVVSVVRFMGEHTYERGETHQNCWLVLGRFVHVDECYLPEGNRVFPDAYLRAIRDPGEDARDETLEWLPVPHKETA